MLVVGWPIDSLTRISVLLLHDTYYLWPKKERTQIRGVSVASEHSQPTFFWRGQLAEGLQMSQQADELTGSCPGRLCSLQVGRVEGKERGERCLNMESDRSLMKQSEGTG